MADFNETESARNEAVRAETAYGDAIASVILRETALWTDAQREMLSGVEAMWADWLKRRREAVEATSRSMQRIMMSRNLSELAEAQQDWLSGTAERAAADIGSLATGSVVVTRVMGEFGRSSALQRAAWPTANPGAAASQPTAFGNMQRAAAE